MTRRRQGHDVAFCTVDRIMRRLGLASVVPGHRPRRTIRTTDRVHAGGQLNQDSSADTRVRRLLPHDRGLDDGEFDRPGVQGREHGVLAA
jgi:hypothetical protein